MLAAACSNEGFIEKMGLKGPHPVGGEGEASRRGCTAHSETLKMELVKLWLDCWKEKKDCHQLAHLCPKA